MRVAVLGAGLAGLTVARQFHGAGVEVIVYEAQEEVGGLSRSRTLAAGPYDLAGGRFFVPRDADVNGWVFRWLPRDQWHWERVAVEFYVDGRTFRQPPLRYLLRGAAELLRPRGPEPANLRDWLYWGYGPTLARAFLIPYCEKLWNYPLEQLVVLKAGGNLVIPGLTALPPLTWRLALLALVSSPLKETSMAMGYPLAGGMGALPRALAAGLQVQTGAPVRRLEQVNGRWFVNGQGPYDHLVSTIPLPEVLQALPEVPEPVRQAVGALRWTAMTSACFARPGDSRAPRPFRLLHVFDRALRTHRVVFPWQPGPGPELSVVDGLGRMAPEEFAGDARRLGLGELQEVFYTPYAFPVFVHGYREHARTAVAYLEGLNIHPFGRWQWEHTSMDSTIRAGLDWSARWLQRHGAGGKGGDAGHAG